MDNKQYDSSVFSEKFKNVDEKIEELKERQTKLEERMADNEKDISKIDNSLTIKLLQFEAKFDAYIQVTGDKIDTFAKDIKETNEKFEKKFDNYITSKENQQKPTTDSFKDWLQKIGLKMVEYGLYSAIVLGILKGFKLI